MKRIVLITGIMLIGLIIACGCTAAPPGPPATTPPTTAPPAPGTTAVTTTATTAQPTPPPGGTASVEIRNFAFVPGTLTVSRGTTVTWTNQDTVPHTVASDASAPVAFASGSLVRGSSYSFRFDQAGTYRYHCGIHPSMTGTITVT